MKICKINWVDCRILYIVVVLIITKTTIWDCEKSGVFSVKSTYKYLCKYEYGPNFKRIWKSKIPLKIKIFMWLLSQNAILTKDNLIKQK